METTTYASSTSTGQKTASTDPTVSLHILCQHCFVLTVDYSTPPEKSNEKTSAISLVHVNDEFLQTNKTFEIASPLLISMWCDGASKLTLRFCMARSHIHISFSKNNQDNRRMGSFYSDAYGHRWSYYMFRIGSVNVVRIPANMLCRATCTRT